MTTSNERFFVITEENEAHGVYNIFYIDFESEQKSLKPLLMNFDYGIDILDSHEGKFIASTAFEANNGRIIEIRKIVGIAVGSTQPHGFPGR